MVQAEDMARPEDHEQRIRALEFRSDGGTMYQIKVFEDINDVVVGDDKFIFHIPPDLDQAEIISVSAGISTAGGGDCQVQIRHSDPCETGDDVLSTKLTIVAGDCYDDHSAVVIEGVVVAEGDQLHIDVDEASGKGLDVAIVFTPSDIASIVIEGAQGPPGGVTAWTGEFDGGATYTVNQSVSYGGTSYVAITNVTAGIIPGVTAGWEDFWQVLVERNPNSGFVVSILGNAYPIDTGVKAAIPVPFDCEIVEVTLLADEPGDVVADLWVTDYGSYPPGPGDSITSATPPTLTGAFKTTDTALTGWTTTLNAGDVIFVYVDTVSGIGWLSVGVRVQRL